MKKVETRKVEKPNTEFLYRGNDIVKLWEQYLKSSNPAIKFYLGDEDYVDSIFNGLAQNKEVAIVTNPDNTPYQNKDGKTITLCGEINYKGADVVDKSTFIETRIREVIEQIKSYNDKASHGTKITNHIVIFPYHAGPLHWNLGQIELKFNLDDSSLLEACIHIYEPYGGQASGYKDLIKDINSLDVFNIVKIEQEKTIEPLIKQQYDSSSCGAITAENGKEFLKHQADEKNLLKLPYTSGASELRERHIQEINEEAFFIAQRDNKAYEAKGDKPIEHQFEITQLLKKLIQKPENDWIKQVIILTQAQEDDIIRDNLDLFKQFLIQLDISDETSSKISGSILRPNGTFKEGAIDLIKVLAWNINNNSSREFSNNSLSNKEQPSTSKTQIDQRELKITSPQKVAIIEKDAKLLSIKEKLEKNKELSLDDFEVTKGNFSYEYEKLHKLARPLFTKQANDIELIGESNNLLFRINDFLKENYKDIEQIFRKINFDISEVIDSNGNNILHYAVFRHDLKLINIIIHKAKSDGVLSKLLNHRNVDGTNPLGMAFLFEGDNLAAIEISRMFVEIPEYQISEYLNNKKYMDYSHVQSIGGTNILHNVILSASKCTSKTKEGLSGFFQILTKRIVNEQSDESLFFNPNDPTMNPMLYKYSLTQRVKYEFTSGQYTQPPNKKKHEVAEKMVFYQDQILSTTTDLHMISTSRLFTVLSFNSKRIQQLCKKYFDSLLQIYEAGQHDDSSGDSEDESSHAHKYREMLHGFDSFIKQTLGEDAFDESARDVNFQRTFDKYKYDYSYLSQSLTPHVTSNGFDQQKWSQFWQKMNLPKSGQDVAIYKDSLSKMVVPLFHGVPFMHSQYSNYQRREIVEKIDKINKKLLGRYDGSMSKEEYTLSTEEEILIGIHSRTATATCGMRSLHDVMSASGEGLTRLDDVDGKLREYLAKSVDSRGFGAAMKNYVFNFADSPIRDFWQVVRDGSVPEDIVKYRFPVIATSKAPDHPIRFAIGRNIEGNRGETPMQPEYDNDGYPTHRVAGLLYITMHSLTDLVQHMRTRQVIDVNHAVKTGVIVRGQGFERFVNQLEIDFFGKIDSNKIVCIVPIIYPHIRDSKILKSKSVDKILEDVTYQISTYSISSPDKRKVTSPEKIKTDLDRSPNPDMMTESSNLSGFGKMMVPSIASIVNGLITSIALKIGHFLCSITDTNKLVPYNVKFDQVGQQFTKAQQEIRCETTDLPVQEPLWKHIIHELINDNLLNEKFTRLGILGELNEE